MDVQTVCTLCGVTKATVYRWLKNPDAMPPSARHLIALAETGRILPTTWAKLGWRFANNELCSPINDTMNASQVEQWRLYYGWWKQQQRENELLKEYIEYLEKLTPRATVHPLNPHLVSHTEGKETNPFFNKK